MPKMSESTGVYAYYPQRTGADGKTMRGKETGAPKYMFRIRHQGKYFTQGGFDNKAQATMARYAKLVDLQRGLIDFPTREVEKMTFSGMLNNLADRKLIERIRVSVKDPATKLQFIVVDSYCFKLNGRSPDEQKKDGQKISRLLHAFGNLPARLSEEAILRYIGKRQKEKSVFTGNVMDRTIRLDFNILKRLLALAKAVKLVTSNTAADVEPLITWNTAQPKKRENSRRYINSVEMRKIVAAAVGHMRTKEDWALWIPLMAFTGNRPAQIFRLRLEDFKPADKVVRVNPAAEKSSFYKCGDGRYVVVDSRLNKYLKWWAWKHGLIYDRDRGFIQPDGTPAKGLLFPHVPAGSSTASKQFERVAEGVTEVTAYSLRHTAATDFANAAFGAGYDLKMIADQLGCSVQTLLKSYLKNAGGRGIQIQGSTLAEVMQASHMRKPVDCQRDVNGNEIRKTA